MTSLPHLRRRRPPTPNRQTPGLLPVEQPFKGALPVRHRFVAVLPLRQFPTAPLPFLQEAPAPLVICPKGIKTGVSYTGFFILLSGIELPFAVVVPFHSVIFSSDAQA
jgi:hypothetical protein